MSDIREGTYRGKILDYGVTTTKNGVPQAAIKFGLKTPEGDRVLTWYGGFSGESTKWTIKALLTCGLSKETRRHLRGACRRSPQSER
jgi:hypothetical protein